MLHALLLCIPRINLTLLNSLADDSTFGPAFVDFDVQFGLLGAK
jgi:hypothetical protein